MAVRFDALGEGYTCAISLGAISQFSVACWAKISTDRNAVTAIWSLDEGSSVTRETLLTNADGTTLELAEGFSFRSLGGLTVGTWYFIGIAVNGVNGTAVIRPATSSAATISSWSDGANSSTTANTLRIAVSNISNQWLNGCVAAVKVWNGATLTAGELEAESWAYTPRRLLHLAAWYPLLEPSTVDYSGSGRTLSGGSGTATEEGPPIGWRPGPRRIIVPASSVPPIDAEFAVTLPPIGASATGDVTVTGQLAATLPPLDADITAHLGNNAQLDAVLPSLAASLTGHLDVTGTLDATLPALTTDIAVEAEANVVEAVLPPLQAALTGRLDITGQLDATLPPLAVALEGETIPPHGDITITTPGPVRGWAAGTPARAWAATTPARGWRARPPT